jgi:hypothetical protein
MLCSALHCGREAHWQSVLYVPIVRAGERDVAHLVTPLVFCEEHSLSTRVTTRVRRSSRLHDALARRLEAGWVPETEKSWFERTRIEAAG